MPGRPRTPTALKEVRGTAQPSRTNPNEPKVKPGAPEPPEDMSDRAKQMWFKLAHELVAMRVLTRHDFAALESAALAYDDRESARESLNRYDGGERSYVTTSEKGGTMYRPYPEVAMISDADRRFQSWLAKLGLTPADRSRVSALPAETNKTGWEKL